MPKRNHRSRNYESLLNDRVRNDFVRGMKKFLKERDAKRGGSTSTGKRTRGRVKFLPNYPRSEDGELLFFAKPTESAVRRSRRRALTSFAKECQGGAPGLGKRA